ncbi:UbiA family prenyltransferase [Frigidibacter albus]|uniref:UbiA family prenyltransferase n=1 Tax=Frigidibacter albus TaxID=1465486 RepID=A0A6L8VLY8_9RHOB|nr:UbiA family prenyltransferase [Frigidibacter albus]MZQ91233.1 UbiA family prenyltransferase [Frigidibacter albus]NBE33160.1 UbiA family prenyltransferase [Frigidibacter albus]GGH63373.1 prenyltransferase [Frigidibacter albus]
MTVSQVLVVDLDGTLIRSDMLHETFWSAFASDWTTPLAAMAALRQGRAALKRALAARAQVDVTSLPYDPAVLERVRDWRAAGGRTALVSASDQQLVSAIAAHLGLFDVAHGSADGTNLKGAEKAAFCTRSFGEGFHYMGDAAADMPVWKAASRAITVNAAPATRAAVDRLEVEAEHLTTVSAPGRAYLHALRPHQWMKNLLVFVPMFTAHQMTPGNILASLAAFVAFSLIASSVYVLNDLLDLSADRSHPRKRTRPFAAGAIPIAQGTGMAAGLLLAGILISALFGGQFLLVMLGYFALTTGYSLYLKRRLVVDICALAVLYTIRILAGGAATDLPISVWLLAFSIFLFFALAAVKRQAELVDGIASGKVTAHGRGYHVDDLPLVESMATSAGYVAVLVMALYASTGDVNELYSAPHMLWGICLVLLYWISRMVMVTHRGKMHDDPVVFAVKDPVSRSCVILMAALGIAGTVL